MCEEKLYMATFMSYFIGLSINFDANMHTYVILE